MAQPMTWPKWPISDGQTLERVREVLESGRWAISGPSVGAPSQEQRFATAFASWLGVKHCVTLDHGTSALVAALEALDVGYGDEVIIPAMTWCAPAIAALSVNATPVIVDVEADTYCLSPERASEAITPRTKALLPVHMYGCQVNMDEILKLAKEHGLKVLEDSAHQHGSEWNGKKTGTMGDIGIYSMQQGKVLTCGEGGAAVTKSDLYKDRLEQSAWNSRRRLDAGAVKKGWMQLQEAEHRFGTNRCLSEIQAAILLDQLPRLEEQNRKRERMARRLDEELGAIPGLKAMRRWPQVTKQSYYSYVIRVDPAVYGQAALALIPVLREKLGMTDFQLHPAYVPLSRSVIYAPHPRRHALTAEYQKAIDPSKLKLPNSEAAWEHSVVFHHSILLSDEPQLKAIVEGFHALAKKR
jgi:dTDP-4-amino-4,6-dideoxygalactose transaminase